MSELFDAWTDLERANAQLRWTVFRPSVTRDGRHWTLWAFDPREKIPPGAKRMHERLVLVPVDQGEIGAVREMASALGQLTHPRSSR
jgi:hypothetical protein